MACVCGSSSKPLVCVYMILLLQCSTICISGDFQVVGPDQPLPAVSGEDLVIPCSVKPSFSVERMTVEWFRLNQQGQASLVHLYKDGKDQNDRQIQSYQDRTYLFKDDLKMGNASLKLSSVQVSDEGHYKCFIQSGSGYDDALIQVIVRVIGQTPRIISEGVTWDGGISLVCESEGWRPDPVLEWLDSQGRLLTAEPPEMLLGPNGFRVTRRLVAYRGDTNNYVCRLTQKDKRTPFEREVEMEAIFHISDGVFTLPWKIPFIVFVLCIIIILLMVGLIIYYRGRKKWKKQWELVKTKEGEGDFHLENYPDQGLKKMLPVVKDSKRVWLNQCHLSKASCKNIASVLQTTTTLKELDMSNNKLEDEGVEELCVGLSDPKCQLETLRLKQCHLSKASCKRIASVLQMTTTLKELDMSDNKLEDEGLQELCVGLSDPKCQLQTLRLADCKLTEKSWEVVASALQSANSPLRELDLSQNHLQESEEKLTSALQSPNCKLETLRLAGCKLTEESCEVVASAVQQMVSLTELDLSDNHLNIAGIHLSSALKDDINCKLQTLRHAHGELRKYACELTLDPNTAHRKLSLSEGNRKVTWGSEWQPYPDHPERFDINVQALCREGLSGRCYWEAEWSAGPVNIAVAYKSIQRKGESDDSEFGLNDKSWRLHCSGNSYSARHNDKRTAIPVPSSRSSRVGVYLDWSAGTLSFYSVSSNTLTHLHTFHSTFTEPLYPGFMVWPDSSVSLHQIT
ncbi:uncharacterized protein LOC143126118 [Alosa pseudoharengus]|uniref:uncharacterized protein LOC143126118 n=1 Tax=Alosa pseudoharengus TaxID=34774 RepID=UPI003F8A6EE7